MIHPSTELRFISKEIGYGVFATDYIPEGTIVYVKDTLEVVVTPTDYLLHPPEVQAAIDRYSYIDQYGNRIISWDFAKYVNHSCEPNTISTGYGFEIAIRDIQPGEQITDEYGIFNLDKPMACNCGSPRCRKVITPDDFDRFYEEWDQLIRPAIRKLFEVPQPLMAFIDAETRQQLDELFRTPQSYRSVYALKFHPVPEPAFERASNKRP